MAMSDSDCEKLEKLPDCIPSSSYIEGNRVIHITFGGDIRTISNQAYCTYSMDQISKLKIIPGDTLLFQPGKYWPQAASSGEQLKTPIWFEDLHGEKDKPIKIKGFGTSTTLSGGSTPIKGNNSPIPGKKEYAFFKLINCSWIEIDNFTVADCWPCFLYLEDCQYISVRNLKATDSRFLIFARGKETHHILIENNIWQQDPNSVLWKTLDWEAVHHGTYKYLNGGFFGSRKIKGSVIVRKNIIRDAYNGIRMKAKRVECNQRHNLNVEIHDNYFIRIRDNAVEPEGSAINWMVYNNRICNAHSWFSFDRVGGGFWYFFANTGWFNDKPGQAHDGNTGGKIFKFDSDSEPPFPKLPFYVFHNSWYLRCFVTKQSKTRRLKHFNNAVQFCDPPNYPDCVCKSGRNFFDENFDINAFGDEIEFDYDLSNREFPKALLAAGQEQHGISDTGFGFLDPTSGDLQLKSRSMAYSGKQIKLKKNNDWPGHENWPYDPHQTPGILGAFQEDGRLFEGPQFVFFQPVKESDQYVEYPRIIKVEILSKDQMVIHFSTLMYAPPNAKVELHPKNSVDDIKEAPFEIISTRLRIKLDPKLELSDISQCIITLPESLKCLDGHPVTLWSNLYEDILLPELKSHDI